MSSSDSPAAVLSAWSADTSAPLEPVVAALAADDAAVDAYLAGPAAEQHFARKLLGDHVFELGLVLDESPPLPDARWLALARLDPHAFAWNLEADAVLPLDTPEASRALEALLLQTLRDRESRSVLLGWLSHPSFLGDEDAIDRIEEALASAGAALTWQDRIQTVRTLARRGGRWEAARGLAHLLRRSQPEPDEARAIQAIAPSFVDATLLLVLGSTSPWPSQPDWLRELADKVPTDELIDAFAAPASESHARRDRSMPGPAHRAAWVSLASRPEREARDVVGRLIVRASLFLGDEALAAGLVTTLVSQGPEAVPALVTAFLSGLHRRPSGAAIERFLRSHPGPALRASLDLQPDWLHTFEENAMVRLAFRLLPRLSADERAALADELPLHDGARAAIVQDELDALG